MLELSDNIDLFCHSNEDNYMMSLLSDITRMGIDNHLFTYRDLFILNEEEIFSILNKSDNLEIRVLLDKFYNIKKEDVPIVEIGNLKRRIIKPLVLGNRIG